ncbi:hypothetical protein [uncultured Hoeflea sp.]|uniref:hypothetical protein n=1 Tax=uncultured Hoeflea sp. TaxID=538666 RepID=UPI002623AD59|nr:hypothetical protein [uncultured Hoeflea sp.]
MGGSEPTLLNGGLSVVIAGGDIRTVVLSGTEVLRGLSYPVRDADWGTCLVDTVTERTGPNIYERDFADRLGRFSGTFRAELTDDRHLAADVEIRFEANMMINRAGFTLLHPIKGVAGTAMTITHSDGGTKQVKFPRLISPAQPAVDIVGLAHDIGDVRVSIAMEGETFEMEDQRNWSDASYKTYCRPLSRPRPFAVKHGDTLHQRVRVSLSSANDGAITDTAAAQTIKGALPQIMLAHEPSLSTPAALADFAGLPVQFRCSGHTATADLEAIAVHGPATLEIVYEDEDDLERLTTRCSQAGLTPQRIVALQAAYLKSHQPDGPWPDVPPHAGLEVLRTAFPGAAIGGGSLTNFTELNRCRPDPDAVDFVTFGNTAIVHAADDLSVRQTLEALPDIFASARHIASGKPLHLGLLSIGMRSNPYGDAVAANPDRIRMAMAMDDPRQSTEFAAAYAVGVLAAAAEAGVESLALAMPDGPLGANGRPLEALIRHAHALSGSPVTVTHDQDLIVIEGQGGGMAANLSGDALDFKNRSIAAECAIVWGELS